MVLPPHLVRPAVQAASLLDHGFPCTGVPWLEQAVLPVRATEHRGTESHDRAVKPPGRRVSPGEAAGPCITPSAPDRWKLQRSRRRPPARGYRGSSRVAAVSP